MQNSIDRQAAIDLWEKYHPTIAVDAMQYDAELRQLPPAQPDTRLEKIADLVDGSIDHFDLEDAMDLLYQIKDVLNG